MNIELYYTIKLFNHTSLFGTKEYFKQTKHFWKNRNERIYFKKQWFTGDGFLYLVQEPRYFTAPGTVCGARPCRPVIPSQRAQRGRYKWKRWRDEKKVRKELT